MSIFNFKKPKTPKLHLITLSILGIYATTLAPFVADDQRNYLVIAASFIATAVALPIVMSRRQSTDFIWISITIIYSFLITGTVGASSDFSTIFYTALFSINYFIFVYTLKKSTYIRDSIVWLLKLIIYAYCFFSLLQLVTSLAGLPVPNLILSKGLWSYNALASEPSHAGRALAVTMLAYLMLTQPESGSYNLYRLLRNNTRILIAFFISNILTGSSLSIISAPLVILLALRIQWIITLSGFIILIFPLLLAIDSPTLQRAFDFLAALMSMDIMTLVEADHSGAIRVMPLLIYLDKADFFSSGFLFGQGISRIAYYMQGEIIGAGDLVAAGFIPGYIIAFGLLGSLIFISTFILRFLNITTLPFVILWLFLFIISAWNTQLFWYGLMLLRVIYHLLNNEAKIKKPQPQKRNTL